MKRCLLKLLTPISEQRPSTLGVGAAGRVGVLALETGTGLFLHKPPLPSLGSSEPYIKVAVTKRILRTNTRGTVAGLMWWGSGNFA